MNKSRYTQIHFPIQALIAFLIFTSLACKLNSGSGSRKENDLSNAKPGDKVMLSETVQLDIIPNSVIPYGRKPVSQFTNLQLTPNGDLIDGKVDFIRNGQDEFVLIAVLSMDNEMLIGYFDSEIDMNLHMPSGTVLLGSRGYEISGKDQGTVEFSLTGKIFNGYSVFSEKGTAFIFSVPGKVNPQSTLPGDQTDLKTFQANSNVLEMEFDFK